MVMSVGFWGWMSGRTSNELSPPLPESSSSAAEAMAAEMDSGGGKFKYCFVRLCESRCWCCWSWGAIKWNNFGFSFSLKNCLNFGSRFHTLIKISKMVVYCLLRQVVEEVL